MAKKLSILTLLAVLPLVLVLGCGDLGKVDQGRVIAYDESKGTVTIIRDVRDWAHDAVTPKYTHLPPIIYSLPKDPAEMGPEPRPGERMKLDTKTREIIIFDLATQKFKTIPYTPIDQKDKVGKSDPLVKDKKFPIIDKAKKTITLYSPRQGILTTFSLPDEYLEMPPNTWEAGDEVRIYYKEEGKALRFMNITRTDIFKK